MLINVKAVFKADADLGELNWSESQARIRQRTHLSFDVDSRLIGEGVPRLNDLL